MKQIKDYVGKQVAILCKTDEEAKFINEEIVKYGGINLYYCWEKRDIDSKYLEFTLNYFPNNEYCEEGYYETSGYTVYNASEFMNENKFEVGKWYKWLWAHNGLITYGKINKINNLNNSSFVVNEGVHNNKFSGKNGYFYESCKNLKLLTDLTEIQQFLPDGHVDKINTIPEYVECIKPQYWEKTIKSNKNNLIFHKDFITYVDSSIEKEYKENKKHFKPSTKEAYESQFDDLKIIEAVKNNTWVIKQNLSQKVCNWHRKKYESCAFLEGSCKYLISNSTHYDNNIPKGFIELNLEQFEKYVLKEDVIQLKKDIKQYVLTPKESFKPNEINIPKIVKPKTNVNFNLNDTKSVEITVPLTQRKTKVLIPLIIEKFKLFI